MSEVITHPDSGQEFHYLSQREQVEGVYAELTPQLDGMRSQVLRDVWRFTRAWLQEENPLYKEEIYDRLEGSLRGAIVRVKQFAQIGEMPAREDVDYDQLYETLMRLAMALEVPVNDLI